MVELLPWGQDRAVSHSHHLVPESVINSDLRLTGPLSIEALEKHLVTKGNGERQECPLSATYAAAALAVLTALLYADLGDRCGEEQDVQTAGFAPEAATGVLTFSEQCPPWVIHRGRTRVRGMQGHKLCHRA